MSMEKRLPAFNKNRAPLFVLLLAIAIAAVGCSKSPEELVGDARDQIANNDYATAIITLKNLLQSDPDNVDGRLLLAEVSLTLGDPLAAEKELTRARDLGADATQHMDMHYKVLVALGRFTEILELLANDGGADGLTDAQASSYRGRALLGLGSAIEAEAAFAEALRMDAGTREASWGIIAAHVAQGRIAEATNSIAELANSNPDFADAWLLKGQLALRDGRLDDAANDFRMAVDAARAAPDRLKEIPALAGLADVQLSQNDVVAAEQTVQALASISGLAPVTRFLHARLLAVKGEYDEAANELEQVLNIAPNNLSALLLYGSVNLAQENYAQAEAVLSQVVARQPANLAARRMLAAAQLQMAEPGAAVETLAPLLESSADDAQLSIFASQAMLRAGSTDQAIDVLERSLEVDPGNVQLAYTLAATYLSGRRVQDAIALVESIPEDAGDFRRELLLAMAYSVDNRSEEADQQIDAIMETHSQDVTALALAGDFYLRRGDDAKARIYLEQAVAIERNNVSARLGLARLDGRAGDNASAEQNYEIVLGEDANNVIALTSLANIAARQDDLQRSETLLRRAIEASPTAPLPRIMLARTYQRLGDMPQAEQVAKEAARLAPDDATMQAAAGDVLVLSGKYREALAFLKRASELGAESARIWFSLARAQLALGENVDARASLETSLSINPDSIQATTALALVELSDGNAEKAFSIAKDLQTRFPDEVSPISLEADVLMVQRDFAAASSAYARAFEKAPSSLLARRTYQAAESAALADSQEILKQWLEQSPDDIAVIVILAQHNDQQGNSVEATRLYERVIELNDDNVGALNNLAWIYAENGDDRAEGLARRAYELRPDIGSVADTLGWILVNSGKAGEGLALLEEAVTKSPRSGDILYHLAYARNELGDSERSLQILQQLLQQTDEFGERASAEALMKELEAR